MRVKKEIPRVHIISEITHDGQRYRVVEHDNTPALNFIGSPADNGGYKHPAEAQRQMRIINAMRHRASAKFR